MNERDRRYEPEKRERARELYESGLSEREVAEQMGLSKTRVHEYLVEAGVERRPVGSRQRFVRITIEEYEELTKDQERKEQQNA